MRYWPLLQNKTTEKISYYLPFAVMVSTIISQSLLAIKSPVDAQISSPAQIMMLAQREQRGPEILEQLQRLGVQPQVKLQGLFVRGGFQRDEKTSAMVGVRIC